MAINNDLPINHMVQKHTYQSNEGVSKRRALTKRERERARAREPQEEHTHAERRREGEGALRQHSGARGRRPTTKEPKLLLLLFVSLSLAPLPSSSSAAVGEQKHTAHKSAKIGAIFRYTVPRYSFPSLLPLVVRLIWFGSAALVAR